MYINKAVATDTSASTMGPVPTPEQAKLKCNDVSAPTSAPKGHFQTYTLLDCQMPPYSLEFRVLCHKLIECFALESTLMMT